MTKNEDWGVVVPDWRLKQAELLAGKNWRREQVGAELNRVLVQAEPLGGGKAFWINRIRELHRKPWMRGDLLRPLPMKLKIRPKPMVLNRLSAESSLRT